MLAVHATGDSGSVTPRAKHQGGFWLGVEVENAELMMFGADDRIRRIDASEPGLRIAITP
jgi:hypothetical protein